MNNDTSALYNQLKVVLPSTGITIADTFLLGTKFSISVGNASDTANYPGTGKITIPHYANTTFHKVMQAVTSRPINDGAGFQRLFNYHLFYKSTSAISRITINAQAGNNFVVGSRVTLFGYA